MASPAASALDAYRRLRRHVLEDLPQSVRHEPLNYVHARSNDLPPIETPSKTGKKLPGASPLDPLHRLAGPAGSASRLRQDENDKVRKRDCNENTPGAPATGKDCDEYPFGSTAEGAARYMYDGEQYMNDFSVRYINSEENQEAGYRLNAWYQNDRILDGEAFTITIGD
ncbi:NucA/NucB deoxyribonuclease domain-containing protein [Streptomyces indicus]|nr:NucA/NucB deoxyribonuclease domain-containing protein [Streptomyces indicus]